MNDISTITNNLYISSFLDEKSIHHLKEQDFRLIISMIGATLPEEDFNETTCKVLFLKTYDNFLFPIPARKLQQGIEAAIPVIERGHKVLIYCQEGKRRSVTMAASILITSGYTAEKAMKLIKEKRLIADPYRWYVKKRILRYEKNWLKRNKNV